MKYSALLIILFGTIFSFGQNTNNIWYFGDGNFLDFNTLPPTISAGGTSNPAIVACNWSTAAGASMMCDNTGQLLFYSDGANVWDVNYNLMPNGTGLFAAGTQTLTASQSIVIPNPAGNSLYYLFHADASAGNNGLRYSEIDMSLNGGLGDVTANKNILLHANTDQRMKAITHCNGQDVWLVSHDATGDGFKAYLVTAAGVSAMPVVSNVGVPLTNPWFGGYMACSKDGTRIAIAGEFAGVNPWPDFIVELFYFDNQTGNLCNPIMFNTSSDTGGIEFSADGTKVYVCDGELEQYDISSNVPATIEASAVDLAGSMSPGVSSLMRGPDDRIYVTTSCQWSALPTALHVINDPNQPGLACNYQLNFIPVLPRTTGQLPTFYAPTQTGNTCGPVLTASASVSANSICVNDCVNYTNLSSGSIVSYDWTFQGGTPSTFSGANPPQVCYPNIGNYTTTLTVTDCAGNTSSYDIVIDVLDCSGPQPDFQANQTQLCSNDCINFTDLSTGTNVNAWSWSFPGANTTTSSVQNPQNICYNTPGTYDVSLTVTDDMGTNTITVPNYIVVDACIPPIANFDAPDTICEGTCIDLFDLSTNSPTQWNWTLNGATPASANTQNVQNACFNNPGTYSLELVVSNAYGNDTYSKDIVVLSMPNAGTDVSIVWCETELPSDLQLLLDPGTSLNGAWLNPQGTPAFSGTIFSPQQATPGIYLIQYVLTNFMCSDTVDFEIQIDGMPNAGTDGSLAICDNDLPVDLMNVIQGNPDPNGTWSPPLVSGNSLLDPSVDAAGVYTYTVAQNTCVSDTSKATVTITYVFDVEILPVDDLCSTSDELGLQATLPGGIWSGTGITDNALGLFNPSSSGAGVHTIVYHIEIDDCEASTSADIHVVDVPAVDLGDGLINCYSEPITLEVTTNPDDQILWSNGDTDNSAVFDFYGYSPGDQYVASVEVSNSCGTSSDFLTVELIDCDVYVYVPNSFTPDGDEHNQLFSPVVTGDNITDYELSVFNRWGEVVFQSRDLSQGWDGTYNGTIVQEGSFVWTLRIIDASMTKTRTLEYNGHVTVIR